MRKRWIPSPAMMIACIALFVALAGSSTAVVNALQRNSVGTLQIRNGAVKTPDLANGAVTSLKVRNGSLQAVDFAAGQLPKGEKGEKGDKGDPGAIGAITVRTQEVSVPGGVNQNGAYDTVAVEQKCAADEKAISAGTGWSTDADDQELWTSYIRPLMDGTNVVGFRARGGNDTATARTFTLYVLCYKG
jgi:hypothetical protein